MYSDKVELWEYYQHNMIKPFNGPRYRAFLFCMHFPFIMLHFSPLINIIFLFMLMKIMIADKAGRS